MIEEVVMTGHIKLLIVAKGKEFILKPRRNSLNTVRTNPEVEVSAAEMKLLTRREFLRKAVLKKLKELTEEPQDKVTMKRDSKKVEDTPEVVTLLDTTLEAMKNAISVVSQDISPVIAPLRKHDLYLTLGLVKVKSRKKTSSLKRRMRSTLRDQSASQESQGMKMEAMATIEKHTKRSVMKTNPRLREPPKRHKPSRAQPRRLLMQKVHQSERTRRKTIETRKKRKTSPIREASSMMVQRLNKRKSQLVKLMRNSRRSRIRRKRTSRRLLPVSTITRRIRS